MTPEPSVRTTKSRFRQFPRRARLSTPKEELDCVSSRPPSYSFLASPGCEELCAVDSIEVTDVVCESDSTYSLTITPQMTVLDEIRPYLTFRTLINGENKGFEQLDAMPLVLEHIPILDDGVGEIEICIFGGVGECCNTIQYDQPNCLNTNISVVTPSSDIHISPNPTNDIIRIEDAKGELSILDSGGRVVLSRVKYDGQINVESFPPGVYYVIMQGESLIYGKFIKI